MKNLYLNTLALLVCAFSANAQLTLTKAGNEPVIGDLDKRTNYDSTTVVPKNTGAGQTWNFTSMTSTPGSYTTAYISPSSAPNATLFPAATIASNDLGNNRYDFNRSSGSIFEMLGQSDLVNSEFMVFSNYGILRSWPISYGSSSTDNWAALQTSPSGTMSMVGTVTISAPGSGTVILPNGNKHNNCLQVIETITMTVSSGTFSANALIRNTFYYSSSSKFPIFEMYYESFPGDPLKFGASANSDALLAGISENGVFTEPVSVYPNPVKDELFISLNGQETPMALEIMDLQGRNVFSQEFSTSVNVQSLEQGLYILKLSYKDQVTYKRFIKIN
jgi:hypothetical protein